MSRKLLESVADIAYIAGTMKYYSGDSRADIDEFIWWAKEFEKLHKKTDWSVEDYMTKIEEFAEAKIKTVHI